MLAVSTKWSTGSLLTVLIRQTWVNTTATLHWWRMESTSPGLAGIWHPSISPSPHLSGDWTEDRGIVTGYPSLPPTEPGLISYLGRRQHSSGRSSGLAATLMWVDIWGEGEGEGHRAGSSNENRHNHNQTLALRGRLIGGREERAWIHVITMVPPNTLL